MKISDELVNDAKPYAAAEHRSVTKKIEYWARIGKAVTDNPDMPVAYGARDFAGAPGAVV